MAKNPEAGKVKTRLAKEVGAKKAVDIYIELLEHSSQTLAQLTEFKKVIYHSPTVINDAPWIPEGFDNRLQSSGDLGSRMQQAAEEELLQQNKVIIIGADCAALQTQHIRQAAKALEQVDVVLGPSEDGGYYLIGIRKPMDLLFKDMPWGTDSIFELTLERLQQSGASTYLLPRLYDIDHKVDWLRWKNES